MSAISFLAAVLFIVGASADINDFDEKQQGYEFIYHDTRNVILTIHGHSCYFAYVPDTGLEYSLSDTSYPVIGSARSRTERFLISEIHKNNADVVHSSTLEAMREKYKDLLADFHCLDKHVYELDFSSYFNSHHHGSSHGGDGH